MDLERVGKHDEDNNSGLADGGEDGWGICARLAECRSSRGMLLTHSNHIASDVVSEREITGDCNEYVHECCDAYASEDHTSGPEMRVISDLIKNREHLRRKLDRIARRSNRQLTF